MANIEIREAAKNASVPLWKVARFFGVTDSTFSKKMREEFSPADKEKALNFIAAMRKEEKK